VVRQLAAPRGRHREVREGIAALRRQEFDDFARIARRCVLGLRREPAMAAILAAAADHVKGVRDHADASDRVRDAVVGLGESRISPEALMAAETFVRATGLFAASSGFAPLIHRGLRHRAESTSDVRDLLKASVSAIHQGDLELAARTFRRIKASAPGDVLEVETVGRYIDIWARNGMVTRSTEPNGLRAEQRSADLRFSAFVGAGPVLIYGPGPTTQLPQLGNGQWKVIRILMPEVYAWQSPEDLVSGQADVAYMNHEAQLWLSQLPDGERADVAARFSILVAKKSAERLSGVSHPGLRVAWSSAPLYLTGSENTVPAITFDLLALAQVPVAVIGTTFFASASSYRPDNRRLQFYEGVRVDDQGRTGLLLERCTMLASHNAVENRTLIRNLVDAGLVTGDSEFSEVVALSDEAYLERLDELYGVGLL